MPPAPRVRPSSRSQRPARPPLAREHLAQRPLASDLGQPVPEVVVKSPTWHAHLFRKRLGAFGAAKHGDLVRLVSGTGEPLGLGHFNSRAEVAVRVLTRKDEPLDDAWWDSRMQAALGLRRDFLRLDEATNACRLVHAEGDGLPGIVVDRFDNVLVAEVFSLAMFQRARAFIEKLAPLAGTEHWLIRPGPNTHATEGFAGELFASPALPRRVVVREHGVEYEVDLEEGHKTGFFCDQRDNRALLAEWDRGGAMLDLCCYTGGFAVAAAVRGKAREITAVDLDEDAVAVARRNAQRNRAKIRCVHADSFAYMRDMLRGERTFETVVLDPPKLIDGRGEIEEGRRKYFDFNRLALQLVAPGGLLVTCSCSGLLPAEEFVRIVSSAAPAGRRLQFLSRTGAAPDHPVAADCPETEYLKALWVRVL
jgi:23S rRNA (cytosine1962-C5)-methyltransferase